MADTNDGVVWDLTSYFPVFKGPEMQEFKLKLQADITQLKQRASQLDTLTAANADSWEKILLTSEDLARRLGHLSSYISCLESAYTDNEDYSRERAALVALYAEFNKFDVDVLRAFKTVSDEAFEVFCARDQLLDAAHCLRRIRERAQHIMSREQEMLAADLNVNGLQAWGRLYDKVSGKLEFDVTLPDGKTERKPISQWRSMMSHVDRDIGRAAFEGGNKAWQGIEDVCAAALNAIAGIRLTLNTYRGIEHFLDMALFQASIRRKTLDAMYQAIYDHLEVPRKIFRTKAQFLGRKGLWFFEREAPLPIEAETSYSWQQATDTVGHAFEAAYPALAAYFKGVLEKKWVESEARPAKRAGAFCTGSSLINEQRVYMTFNGTLGNLATIAHEVGHAWHGHLMRDIRPMARKYPMTLAETASTFAELILAEAVYNSDRVNDAQKLLMLDAELCGAAVLLLDITTRFEFEKTFHEERQKGEVPVSRLKALMVDTQHRIFGDSLLGDGADPYFWASKLHFYITGVTFYNFPYTFGFLLARAMVNQFQHEGAGFFPKYERLLKLSGSDTVEQVVKRSVGKDVTQPEFWAESIRSLEKPLKRYTALLNSRSQTASQAGP